jgi:hypothetical protein
MTSERITVTHRVGSILYAVDTPVALEGAIELGFVLMGRRHEEMIAEKGLDIAEFERGRREYWTDKGYTLMPLPDRQTYTLTIRAEDWGR